MQYERDPLGGSQRFEHHEQRETDRVGEDRLVLGVDSGFVALDRVGRLGVERLLASRFARSQHVQAHPADDRRQPPAQVRDIARVRAAEPEPGFLYGIVRLAQGTKHPVGHRSQVGPVGLEPLRQPFTLAHRSHVIVGFRHRGDVPKPDAVTSKERPHPVTVARRAIALL